MKTKLLKKVRKRFEIFHLPKGFLFYGEHVDYNLFKLNDVQDIFEFRKAYVQFGRKNINGRIFCEKSFDTIEECIYYLKCKIIKRLRYEGYTQRRDKNINITEKKVWSI